MATTTTAPSRTTTSAARSSACSRKTMWLILPVLLILLWSENMAHSFSLLEPSFSLMMCSSSKKNGQSALPRPRASSIRIVSADKQRPRCSHYFLQAQTDDNDDNDRDSNSGNDDIGDSAEAEMVQASEVRMDDGGSNLTDRFKYKVRRSTWLCT